MIAPPSGAEGTETIGPANITLADGTGILAAGTGLSTGGSPPFMNTDGSISFDVPAGTQVLQVLLYWSGQFPSNKPGKGDDDSIVVEGIEVVGTLFGGPAFFFRVRGESIHIDGYRADITDLVEISEGPNTLSISGLDYDSGNFLGGGNQGAGVLLILDDGSGLASIDVRDGMDLGYCGFKEPRRSTIPQTYPFPPAANPRVAEFSLFAGGVSQVDPPELTLIELQVELAGTIQLFDALFSSDGNFWDTLTLPVVIPAYSSSMTIEVISGHPGLCNSDAASLGWMMGALSVPSARLAMSKIGRASCRERV